MRAICSRLLIFKQRQEWIAHSRYLKWAIWAQRANEWKSEFPTLICLTSYPYLPPSYLLSLLNNYQLVTPLFSQLPAFFGRLCLYFRFFEDDIFLEAFFDHLFCIAKLASALNPLVYAISHPKYREALAREIPCLGIGRYIENCLTITPCRQNCLGHNQSSHRRRINTEYKAKVVAAVWGQNLVISLPR